MQNLLGTNHIPSKAQTRKILYDWNDTRREYPRHLCVQQVFEQEAARRPEQTALVCEGERVSYGELNRQANQFARHLRKRGLEPGQKVALCLRRSPELIVGMLAALKAGGAYAPLEPSWPPARLAALAQDLGSPLLVTDERGLARVIARAAQASGRSNRAGGDGEMRAVSLQGESGTWGREPDCDLCCESEPESAAYISFTSGSTGAPKGVCIPHRGITRLVLNNYYTRFSSADVMMHLAPASFDASLFEIWGALLNGATLVIAPPGLLSLQEIGDVIRSSRVTRAWFTAGLFHQIVEELPEVLRPLREVLAGGDVLSPDNVRKALRLFPRCRIINAYGPTENSTFTTTYDTSAGVPQDRPVPIGRPIANTECYVLDKHFQPLPPGMVGEIYAGGDGLAIGYLGNPELTAQKFIPHPWRAGERLYKTGDLGRYLPDGNIEFLGRIDFQVKIRGFRVEPGEIEAVLRKHPAVKSCLVSSTSDSANTKQLVAYVVAGRTAPKTDELRVFLRQHLPDYMVPGAFVFLEALPLSANGKVDRKALPRPVFSSSTGAETVEPRDNIERELLAIWESVLQVRPGGRRDNFFALGGHSLSAVQLVARIQKEFGRNLPISCVFENPTLEEMAAVLRGGKADGASSIVALQPQGSKPPLMLVHGAGGGMFWGYSNLARHLGPDQPVFAFKSRGLDGQEELASIEELAEAYLEELRVFQPQGPYYLGGYCFGGIVAYEMARQLQAEGEAIALLALINSDPPNSAYARFRLTPRSSVKFILNAGRKLLHVLPHSCDWWIGVLHWKARLLCQRLRRVAGRNPLAMPDAENLERWVNLSGYSKDQRRLWATHIKALTSYQPKPFTGRVTLFRSPLHLLYCSFARDYGWGEFVSGGIDLHIVPGAHDSIMEEPYVGRLADRIAATLEKAQSRCLGKDYPSSAAKASVSRLGR